MAASSSVDTATQRGCTPAHAKSAPVPNEREKFTFKKDNSEIRMRSTRTKVISITNARKSSSDNETNEANAIVGFGGFGVVLGVTDMSNGKQHAIKKVADAFCNTVDAKRLYREIKIMQHLAHPNLLSCQQIYVEKDTVYVSSVKMDTNLKRVIDFDLRKLSLRHVKFCVFQILCGLKYLHSCGIVHRFHFLPP
jgi:serine/threonine protein kinase